MSDERNQRAQVAEDYLKVAGDQVTAYLGDLVDASKEPATLFKSMRYSLLAGGKRIRPILCLATGQALGVNQHALMPVAAALELMHCYSLIHDDLPCMDDDDLRRGQPTNHRVFGEAAALLAGDALLTYAFELLAKPLPIPGERQVEMLRVLANAAGCFGMVAGQMADIEAEGQTGTLETLQFIHVRKTARLIQASVELVAIYAGVDDTTRRLLASFGRSLGLSFQMVDDLLDVTSTTDALGKSVGSDERLEKLTYPKLVGVEQTRVFIAAEHGRATGYLSQIGLGDTVLRSLADYVIHRAN